jgi:hypothetical protein
MTPQERLDYLLEIETRPNLQVVTVATVIKALGPANARIALGTLKQAGDVDPIVGAAYQSLSTVGITLHQPDRQEMIVEIGAVAEWPEALTDAVRDLGRTRRPRWQWEGYATEPTLTQVTNQMLVDAARSKITAINAWLDTYDVADKTVEQVEQYIADLFASEDGNL